MPRKVGSFRGIRWFGNSLMMAELHFQPERFLGFNPVNFLKYSPHKGLDKE